jgi:hypothetical protein
VSAGWHYAESGETVGPLDLKEMQMVLSKVSDPRNLLITGVSRQLWINGAGAIRNLSEAQGRRLAADTSDRMIAYLIQNTLAGPDMSDDAPVFSAAPGGRGNVLDLVNTDVSTIIDSVLAARAAAARRMWIAKRSETTP